MKTMSHRQRVITAINHQEPDFVPLDLGTGGNHLACSGGVHKDRPAFSGRHTHRVCASYDAPGTRRLADLQALDIDTRPVYIHQVARIFGFATSLVFSTMNGE